MGLLSVKNSVMNISRLGRAPVKERKFYAFNNLLDSVVWLTLGKNGIGKEPRHTADKVLGCGRSTGWWFVNSLKSVVLSLKAAVSGGRAMRTTAAGDVAVPSPVVPDVLEPILPAGTCCAGISTARGGSTLPIAGSGAPTPSASGALGSGGGNAAALLVGVGTFRGPGGGTLGQDLRLPMCPLGLQGGRMVHGLPKFNFFR